MMREEVRSRTRHPFEEKNSSTNAQPPPFQRAFLIENVFDYSLFVTLDFFCEKPLPLLKGARVILSSSNTL
jgi:hypothetical protein